jgi:homoserine kinase
MLSGLAVSASPHQTLEPGLRVAVAGSVSNLGPGFDALSVAVGVYLTAEVVGVDPARPGTLQVELADGKPIPGENRVLTGFERAHARFGDSGPGLVVRVASDIPMRAGLGSSAAATVAGLRLYEAATRPRAVVDLMRVATEIEGHPDNAAAAIHGGLTVSCQRVNGQIETLSWTWPPELKFVVGTPAAELETAFARTVLPSQVSLKDAIFNLQRALLLVRAIDAGRYDLLREALGDRWHQPARQRFVPGLAEALALDHPAVLGVCLSGAGPSILALALEDRAPEAARLLEDIYRNLGVACTIRTLSACQPSRALSND